MVLTFLTKDDQSKQLYHDENLYYRLRKNYWYCKGGCGSSVITDNENENGNVIT